ncbi:MAG: DUF2628 domain-containing protein [Hyphomicrobiales bacterium]|nr:DUF2628 domain-containing protein [Hyphomicrobiales bacterium]
MTTYSIYARPDDRGAADAIFLPDGFSWRAFVFTWVWALWNRMWIVALLALSVMLIATALPTVPQFLLSLAVSLVMGLHGNDLLGWSLTRRRYAEIALSNGASLEEAELRFYAGDADVPAHHAPTVLPAAHDVLGLFGARS